MIDRQHALPITHQAKLLKVSRGSVYYLPKPAARPTWHSCAASMSCT